MRFDWGLAVVGVIWPLVLLGAVVIAILSIGLAAGWPLMVSAVGVERGDSFQAISTAFSYLYQRPIHFAFYGFISCVLAGLGFFAAGLFADTTVMFALWAGSFGMGHERTADVIGAVAQGNEDPRWGIQALQFWTDSLKSSVEFLRMGLLLVYCPSYLPSSQTKRGTQPNLMKSCLTSQLVDKSQSAAHIFQSLALNPSTKKGGESTKQFSTTHSFVYASCNCIIQTLLVDMRAKRN